MYFLRAITRYQPVVEKSNGLPIFNIHSQKYKNRKKNEIDIDNCQIMFDTGYVPPLAHKGNLGCEAFNAFIKLYVYIICIYFVYNLLIIIVYI